MQPHPYAELFPMMEGQCWADFVDSIKKLGQRVPIVVHEGQILDGRNRYRACVELGLEPKLVTFDGDDPLGAVLALNDRRRADLTEGQRGLAADKLATMSEGRPKTELINSVLISLETAAGFLKVSRNTAVRARKLRREAAPEIVAAVERGTMSLNRAMKTIPAPAKPTADEQAQTSRQIQQMALEAGISVQFKGPELSKAVCEATGQKLLRTVDLKNPDTRATVEAVIAKMAGKSLDDQYAAHRSDVSLLLSETAQQKLDRLVAREVQLRTAAFEQEVIAAARARLPDESEALRAAKARADGEFKKYAAARKGIAAQLSEEDYRFLLNVLHPDRAPADRRDKFARAFNIVRQLDAYIEAFKA